MHRPTTPKCCTRATSHACWERRPGVWVETELRDWLSAAGRDADPALDELRESVDDRRDAGGGAGDHGLRANPANGGQDGGRHQRDVEVPLLMPAARATSAKGRPSK